MAKTLLVANWKMNLNASQASLLIHRLQDKIRIHRDIEIVLAPSMLTLQPMSLQIDRRKFRLAAQNAFPEDEGAYTGEVSFSMLRDIVHYAIIGHSERRIYFNESLKDVGIKVAAAVRNGITPIICVGENKQERKEGETKRVIHDQVTTAIRNLTSREIRDIVIAYEPVWAISTFGGSTAKPDQVQDAINYIRYQIEQLYGAKTAAAVRVIYGGSVDDQSVRAFLELGGCDGALVGGASLNAYKFAGIVEAAYRLQVDKGEDE